MFTIAALIVMASFCHTRTQVLALTSLTRTFRSSNVRGFGIDATISAREQRFSVSAALGLSRWPNYGTSRSFRLFSTPSDTDTIDISIDPYSEEAKQNLSNLFSDLSSNTSIIDTDVDKAHKSLLKLTEQVLSWNQRLNLVSRKDCTASVVYHRHVLPSVALLPLIVPLLQQNEDGSNSSLNIIDVGTGGGFPGLPLALLLPSVQFTMVDSVQKKLVAVSEMASELDIDIRVHHGRVEEMYTGEGKREHFKHYDVVLGRSVTALPRFCGWVSDLMKPSGRLIYIIGGDLEEVVTSRIESDTPIDSLLQRPDGTSDKRALIFRASNVEMIAKKSGEKLNFVRNGGSKKKNVGADIGEGGKGKKLAKGEWARKRNDVKKERGYEGFKRYEF
jgi:16S rRNA (guanine527-N7)-methyltransferase